MRRPQLSLLMPVRNEGPGLAMTLRIMKAVIGIPHEVLVVYDDPEDRSIPVIRKAQESYPAVRAVLNTRGRGVINAIRSGVEAAKGRYVLVTVADDIGPLLAAEQMLALMEGGCDLVSATRYAQGGRVYGGHPAGRLFSRVANRLFHHIGGSVLTDATVGFKMFRPGTFRRLELRSPPVGWLAAFELSIKAQLAGMTLGEVPITSLNRLYGGASSFRFRSWVVEYLRLFVWGCWRLRRSAKGRRLLPVRAAL